MDQPEKFDHVAANACFLTTVSAVSGALAWKTCEKLTEEQSSKEGFCVGAMCGLVSINPGSGYVTPWAAFIIGSIGAILAFSFRRKNKEKKWVDDNLDVFALHGVAGFWGTFAVGLFASNRMNSVVDKGKEGLFFGDASLLLLWKQLIIALCSAAWAFSISFIIIWFITKVPGIWRLMSPNEGWRDWLKNRIRGNGRHVNLNERLLEVQRENVDNEN